MRLVLATLLALVGGLLAPAALLAWDAQQVLLDTDRWVETTSPVIEDPAARTALATVVVDQASAQLACSGGIAGRLAAGRLGARARAGAVDKVEAQLATERGRSTWHGANRAAHEQFVRAARSDTVELDDRLLDAGKLLELAAATVVVLRRADDLLDGGDGATPDPCGGSLLAVLDGDGLRAAGLLARTLEVASWLPAALAGASLSLLLLALLVARRRMLALATWAACAAAFALAAYMARDSLVVRLVDDIGSAPTRDLATIVLDRALEAPAAHVLELALAMGVLFLAAVVWTMRRPRGKRRGTISGS